MYSGPITIINRHGYRVDSYGNGAAYALTRLDDGASTFFQGDDAESFRAELDGANVIYGREQSDRVLRHILSGYGDILEMPHEHA